MRDRPLIERCLAVQLIVMPFLVLYWGLCEYLLRTDVLSRAFDLGVLLIMQRAILGYAAIWIALFAVTLGIREKRREGADTAIAYVTTQLYGLSNVFAAYTVGTVTSPFLVLLVGSGLIALVLFPPRVAWTAVVTIVAVLAAQEVAQLMDLIPYAPLLVGSPVESSATRRVWTILMWFIVGTVSALVIFLFNLIISELREHEARLHDLTRTDALTGLANRRHFMDQLLKEHARAVRYDRPLSCVMIDLDHFKSINDEHGHAVGDQVLCQTSARLGEALRTSDLLARYGGEEFVAILPDTDLEGAERVAERCRAILAEAPVMVDGDASWAVPVTASFGVAALNASAHADDPEALLRAADMALYDAKDLGRNRVSLSQLDTAPST